MTWQLLFAGALRRTAQTNNHVQFHPAALRRTCHVACGQVKRLKEVFFFFPTVVTSVSSHRVRDDKRIPWAGHCS